MSTPDERIEELIAAAVSGELSPAEEAELARLRAEHPWIDEELASLHALGERLQGADAAWTQPASTDVLRARIMSEIPATAERQAQSAAPSTPSARSARRRWMTPVLAAACLVVGLAIGVGTPALLSVPPSGPPGTLGAIEQVEVDVRAAGIRVDADLVAHTWGTEAVLDVTGLDVGATYSVVFVGIDGTEFSAGEMLGSSVEIHCRLNAAVMRDDAARLEIRDAESNPVASAALPAT